MESQLSTHDASALNVQRRRLPFRRRWLALGLALVGLMWFVPPVWRLGGGPVTVTRWDKKKGKTEVVVGPSQKGWITNKRVSRHVLHAIIASEDGKFYTHHGIDWESTLQSARYNWQRKRYARGASTISQQVVKMAFLAREKTLIRKAREALGVTLMELMLSKDQILEWYINLAEFGDGVYGINQGSWHYFKTKPELLTIEQAVHLALVLPSPNAWSGGLRRRDLTRFGQRRFAAILNNLKSAGYITKTQWITALSRGNFGRPIAGYESLLAAEESHKELCPGSPGCPDEDESDDWDETSEQGLTFPEKGKHETPPVELPPSNGIKPQLTPPLSAPPAPGATPGPPTVPASTPAPSGVGSSGSSALMIPPPPATGALVPGGEPLTSPP